MINPVKDKTFRNFFGHLLHENKSVREYPSEQTVHKVPLYPCSQFTGFIFEVLNPPLQEVFFLH